ncbi:MAG: hypothetical protein HOP19_15880 [Acidobacteria bacterium]|nr:hypothetical protein [Acidobacteriota bacterium]
MTTRAKYVWDYDLSQDEFDALLSGKLKRGSLDRDWAAVRLIEWASYDEMIRRIGFAALVREWPHWRLRVRAESQRRGLDFVVEWIPQHHPELLKEAEDGS